MRAKLTWMIMLVSLSAFAGEVIDVGKYKVQGTMRGPEVQYIDADRVDVNTASKMVQDQLKSMENELLTHQMPGEAGLRRAK